MSLISILLIMKTHRWGTESQTVGGGTGTQIWFREKGEFGWGQIFKLTNTNSLVNLSQFGSNLAKFEKQPFHTANFVLEWFYWCTGGCFCYSCLQHMPTSLEELDTKYPGFFPRGTGGSPIRRKFCQSSPIWHLSPFLGQGLSPPPPSRGLSPKIWKI